MHLKTYFLQMQTFISVFQQRDKDLYPFTCCLQLYYLPEPQLSSFPFSLLEYKLYKVRCTSLSSGSSKLLRSVYLCNLKMKTFLLLRETALCLTFSGQCPPCSPSPTCYQRFVSAYFSSFIKYLCCCMQQFIFIALSICMNVESIVRLMNI